MTLKVIPLSHAVAGLCMMQRTAHRSDGVGPMKRSHWMLLQTLA